MPHPTIFHTLTQIKLILQPFLPKQIKTKLPTKTIKTKPHPPLHHKHQILILKNYTQPTLSPNTNTTTTQILNHLKINIIPTNKTNYYNTINYHLNTQKKKLTQTHNNINT